VDKLGGSQATTSLRGHLEDHETVLVLSAKSRSELDNTEWIFYRLNKMLPNELTSVWISQSAPDVTAEKELQANGNCKSRGHFKGGPSLRNQGRSSLVIGFGKLRSEKL
jgi:hypothetical protein